MIIGHAISSLRYQSISITIGHLLKKMDVEGKLKSS